MDSTRSHLVPVLYHSDLFPSLVNRQIFSAHYNKSNAIWLFALVPSYTLNSQADRVAAKHFAFQEP